MIEQVQKIPESLIEQLKERFLNKKISVIDSKGTRWVGICNFIGLNPFIPSWGLQVTLNRTPLTNLEIKNIELFDKQEDPRTMKAN